MSQPTSKKKTAPSESNETAERNLAVASRLTPQLLFGLVRTVSFWIAVTLPFLYVPLLFVGIDTAFGRGAFLALLILNVAALLVGHTYQEPSTDG